LGNTAYFLPAREDATYLLGLLNSKVFFTYAKKVFVEKQNGWYEVQPKGLEAFPIPDAPAAERQAIAELAQKCLDAKGVDCEEWEAEIDERVVALYGL
jgi:restriction endonuclease S subunit